MEKIYNNSKNSQTKSKTLKKIKHSSEDSVSFRKIKTGISEEQKLYRKSKKLEVSQEIVAATRNLEPNVLISKKGRISKIPILEVNRHNVNSLWPYIMISIKSCDFLSFDLEFTGLGGKRRLFCKSIEDRYTGAKYAAETRGVLAFGLATFTLKRNANANTKEAIVKCGRKRLKLSVKVFNFLTSPQDEFICENDCLTYLADGNFDLSKVFKDGILYKKGEDEKKVNSPMRSLINEIFTAGKPMAVHNGFLDLAFLYGNFYGNLPEKSGEFLADFAEISAQGGMYDSKYLSEFEQKLPASFLEYVFRFCQRNNDREARLNRLYLSLNFDLPPNRNFERFLKIIECPLPAKNSALIDVKEDTLCTSLSNHGYCKKGPQCGKSHDLDEILDCLEAKQVKKRQKRKRRFSEISSEATASDSGDVICERVPCRLKEGLGIFQKLRFTS